MNLLSLWPRARRKTSPGGDAQRDEKLLSSLFLLAWAVEARDPYTGGHLWRVARLSRLLAQAAGLDAGQVARIAIGAFLHDLGKIGIPDAVLGKKSKLDDAEYEVIKTHPEIGLRMLAGHPLAALAEDAVLLHHETPDGRGYPFGRRGEEIPLVARIVGICDAFDAMTSTRPYRAGMPIARAMGIIESELGRQFDARLGALFIALADNPELAHIVGHSDEGIPLERCGACGPIVVRPRQAQAGDTLYCPACHSEYTIAPAGGLLATGKQNTARALAASPDTSLIGRLVGENLTALG
ncbi:HD-GYP domain-containing protein [Herbaspirillum sp. WKF16]|uniref:HD-GYP domain-containing protein n=1 Tax=Herbaspirillum sp. WKF16 TaxID=3028312 RepID=UPI0023A928D0|nr:HD-GYP domain-containing protein [Herbaspirillum sp. WKF16]WDZ97243.1 HD-GYP domain-containing protein [Herbaspirillum sp. WKF16]